MEQILNEINILNKSLINEKNEIRNKLFEKIINCKCYGKIDSYEDTLIERASNLFKDEEYEKLRIKYLKLSRLTSSINYFIKEC